MKWKALYAAAYLAFRVAIRIGRRLTLRKSPGLGSFLKNYLGDRVVPFTAEEHRLLPSFSRCISCGLCDSLCPAVKTFSQDRFLGPSFVAHAARSIPDFAIAPLDMGACEGCRGCESICPERVPIKRIISFMRDKEDLIHAKGSL